MCVAAQASDLSFAVRLASIRHPPESDLGLGAHRLPDAADRAIAGLAPGRDADASAPSSSDRHRTRFDLR